MVDTLLGWKKDKYDTRDYLHVRKVAKIPSSVLLTEQLTPIRNQGNISSCVGFGVGININSVWKKLGIYVEWESPTWIYNGARYIEGTLSQDMGCYPKDALDWLLKNGTLLEHFWAYNPNVLDKSAPPSERMAQAVKYTNFAYYRVVEGVGGICSALADGHLVSIGTPWFDKWLDAPNGVLVNVTENDSVAGGHETCLYGYDQQKSVFYGANSWGEDWGNRGLYTMPFDAIQVFKALGGYDAHYIIFEVIPLPPEPEPSKCKWGNGIAKVLNTYSRVMRRQGRFYYLNPPKEE